MTDHSIVQATTSPMRGKVSTRASTTNCTKQLKRNNTGIHMLQGHLGWRDGPEIKNRRCQWRSQVACLHNHPTMHTEPDLIEAQGTHNRHRHRNNDQYYRKSCPAQNRPKGDQQNHADNHPGAHTSIHQQRLHRRHAAAAKKTPANTLPPAGRSGSSPRCSVCATRNSIAHYDSGYGRPRPE